MQTPSTQDSLLVQEAPQAPQLARELRLSQVPSLLQSAVPSRHSHTLFAQYSVLSQLAWQVPQLRGSLARSTQLLLKPQAS